MNGVTHSCPRRRPPWDVWRRIVVAVEPNTVAQLNTTPHNYDEPVGFLTERVGQVLRDGLTGSGRVLCPRADKGLQVDTRLLSGSSRRMNGTQDNSQRQCAEPSSACQIHTRAFPPSVGLSRICKCQPTIGYARVRANRPASSSGLTSIGQVKVFSRLPHASVAGARHGEEQPQVAESTDRTGPRRSGAGRHSPDVWRKAVGQVSARPTSPVLTLPFHRRRRAGSDLAAVRSRPRNGQTSNAEAAPEPRPPRRALPPSGVRDDWMEILRGRRKEAVPGEVVTLAPDGV